MGKAKEKRKNRDKRIGTGAAPWVGVVKEEKFPHTMKPLHWWGRCGGGSFKATEESTATRVQRAKQKDSCTEDWSRPAFTSLTLVCSPTCAGGDWELKLGLWRSDPKERTGVGSVKTA